MADLNAKHPYLHTCSYPQKPISWGKEGNTHELIINRIKHWEDDLKDNHGTTCNVGGDMNFQFYNEPHYEEEKFQNARTTFMENTKKELREFLENKRQRDPQTNEPLQNQQNTNLDKYLERINSYSFQECFMGKLNLACKDITEPNFVWANADPKIFGKPVKSYFDFDNPEFQLEPADCLTFLNNTERVYSTAQKMAAELGMKILPDIQHIHFSVLKDGVNITTRDKKNGYNPNYVKILESVGHLAHTGAFLLYPLRTYGNNALQLENYVQHMRISEDKISRNYEMNIRALEDNFEFRALYSDVPHLALALLFNVAGVHMGLTKHNEKFCEENHICRATPDKPVQKIFPKTKNAVLNFMLKQCTVGEDGYLLPSTEWTLRNILELENYCHNLKDDVYYPPIFLQWLRSIKVENNKFIVPEHFDAKVGLKIPIIDGQIANDKMVTYENAHTLNFESPKELKTALEQGQVAKHNTLIYAQPDGISVAHSRAQGKELREKCFKDPLIKDYFGKALMWELGKDYSRALKHAYPGHKAASAAKG